MFKLTCHRFIIAAFVPLAFCAACDQAPKITQYRELAPTKNSQQPVLPQQQQTDNPVLEKILNDSVAEVDLRWDVPDGWMEQKGSGMRLASFTSDSQPSIQTTIISLGGMAGGVEGNVLRWMRQINLNITSEKVTKFLNEPEIVETQSGESVEIFDLTQLQDSSMPDGLIGAIWRLNTKTLFFKMTGDRSAVQEEKPRLIQLINSLKKL